MKIMKNTVLLLSIGITLVSTGCAKVPMEPKELSDRTKQFNLPPEGKSGLYVFRGSGVGTALKKDIYVNQKCLGESAPNVFFYTTVEGDQKHEIATESEFSPNVVSLKTESGKNYFLKQYIKMGVFVGGADLKVVSEEEGKEAVSELEMAKNGICGK